MKSFNVVIATSGRPTLQRMIDSIAPQLEGQDYLTIIWDCDPVKLDIKSKCQVIEIHNPEPLGYWGHGSRTNWQNSYKGDYILNGDDDDIYAPDAMNKIRKKCTEHKLYFFKYLTGVTTVPVEPKVVIGNVGTPCGVYPNIGNFPKWEYEYSGDGQFYIALSKILEYEFVNEVIYVVRPERGMPKESFVPRPAEIICSCGQPAFITFDPVFERYEGYCSKCQKVIK